MKPWQEKNNNLKKSKTLEADWIGGQLLEKLLRILEISLNQKYLFLFAAFNLNVSTFFI